MKIRAGAAAAAVPAAECQPPSRRTRAAPPWRRHGSHLPCRPGLLADQERHHAWFTPPPRECMQSIPHPPPSLARSPQAKHAISTSPGTTPRRISPSLAIVRAASSASIFGTARRRPRRSTCPHPSPDSDPNSSSAITARSASPRMAQRVYFGCAPPPPSRQPPPNPPPISPASTSGTGRTTSSSPCKRSAPRSDRNRTYRAVYDLASGKFFQLADATLADVTPSEDGRWGLGLDDREYRRRSRIRYALLRRLPGRSRHRQPASFSAASTAAPGPGRPTAAICLTFDGKDWTTVNVATGQTANLTASLGVKFFERAGRPSRHAVGLRLGGWSKDGRSVLLYDRYDIWQVAPDGGSPRNLTAGHRPQPASAIALREARLRIRAMRDIDLDQPLLLRARMRTRATPASSASVPAPTPRRRSW